MQRFNQVFLATIISFTAVSITAIALDHTGIVDMRFGDWFQLKIESGDQQLLESGDVSDDSL